MTDAMIRDLQTELWDFYKDVHGIRPRHWTTAEWASLDFLMEQRAVLCNIVNNMSPEQRVEEGWYDDYDDSMDGDHDSALASAGWGTDEDYGRFDDVDF